jgi:cellulose synthase/poly-beta-1,6-N-acetylglucosamine synthase-like glycosyltransferase
VYILMLPTFVNIMQIYSMSNLHDISWGNRPSAVSTG